MLRVTNDGGSFLVQLIGELHLLTVNVIVVVVVLQQDLPQGKETESWPEPLFDVDETISHLHQHVVAETTLARCPHQNVDVVRHHHLL